MYYILSKHQEYDRDYDEYTERFDVKEFDSLEEATLYIKSEKSSHPHQTLILTQKIDFDVEINVNIKIK